MARTITAPELAEALGADPKTLRRVLRAHLPETEQPKTTHHRYALTPARARQITRIWASLH